MAAPVTRACGCDGERLCPTAQSLRRKVNATMPPFEFTKTERTSREAFREHHRAVSAFRRHMGGGGR